MSENVFIDCFEICVLNVPVLSFFWVMVGVRVRKQHLLLFFFLFICAKEIHSYSEKKDCQQSEKSTIQRTHHKIVCNKSITEALSSAFSFILFF